MSAPTIRADVSLQQITYKVLIDKPLGGTACFLESIYAFTVNFKIKKFTQFRDTYKTNKWNLPMPKSCRNGLPNFPQHTLPALVHLSYVLKAGNKSVMVGRSRVCKIAAIFCQIQWVPAIVMSILTEKIIERFCNSVSEKTITDGWSVYCYVTHTREDKYKKYFPDKKDSYNSTDTTD